MKPEEIVQYAAISHCCFLYQTPPSNMEQSSWILWLEIFKHWKYNQNINKGIETFFPISILYYYKDLFTHKDINTYINGVV